jgi:branched-chain amino acid transport system substrate-binding protein
MTRGFASLVLLLSILVVASCGSTAAGRESGPVLIGFFADLSSTGARGGNDALKGAELMIKGLNASGGIDGRKVQLQVIDTKQSTTDAVKAYVTLAQDDGACAVIGSAEGQAGVAVSPVADLARVPLVSLGIDDRITTPEITPENADSLKLLRRFTFMVQPSAAYIAAAMAVYSAEHFPVKRVATLFDPSDPVSSLQERSFSYTMRKSGILVAGSAEMPQGGTDFAAPLARLKDMGCDAVFVCGSAAENTAVAAKVRAMAFNPALLGNQAWYVPDPRAGGADEGAWFCMGIAPDDRALADIGARFKAEYGTEPRPAVVPGWDAAALVVEGVRRAGSSDPQKVRDALEQVSRFPSLRGPAEMDRKTHRLSGQPVAIMRVTGGRSVTVEARFAPRMPRNGAQP